MNGHRIKTFAKILVFGSCLLSFFHTLYSMDWTFQYLSEGRTADSLQPEISRDIEALFLLNSYLVPVMFFGVALWIIAAKKLRRHTINPRPDFDVDS